MNDTVSRISWGCVLSGVWLFPTPWTVAPPASSAHGILQARIPQWVAMASSRGSSRTRARTPISCMGRQILYRLSHQGSPWQSLGPSMVLPMELFHSFSWLSNILLWMCSTLRLLLCQWTFRLLPCLDCSVNSSVLFFFRFYIHTKIIYLSFSESFHLAQEGWCSWVFSWGQNRRSTHIYHLSLQGSPLRLRFPCEKCPQSHASSF